jgi:hypothetical protein
MAPKEEVKKEAYSIPDDVVQILKQVRFMYSGSQYTQGTIGRKLHEDIEALLLKYTKDEDAYPPMPVFTIPKMESAVFSPMMASNMFESYFLNYKKDLKIWWNNLSLAQKKKAWSNENGLVDYFINPYHT